MPYTVTRQQVTDYPSWRRAFEENADAREEAGSRGGHIFRREDDSSEIVVFLAWEDLGAARDYLEGDAIDEEVAEGGVERRETHYLEELGRPNV